MAIIRNLDAIENAQQAAFEASFVSIEALTVEPEQCDPLDSLIYEASLNEIKERMARGDSDEQIKAAFAELY